MMAKKWFPLQHKHSPHGERFRVPWAVAEKAYAVYAKRYGTDQSLDMLADRCGFGVLELIMLLADVPDFPDDTDGWQSDFFNKFAEETYS
jgi:hypothetical protein